MTPVVDAADVLALIPARSGSKSVPDKNVRPFAGKPLIAHSIEQALAARRVGRVLVSTDSERYADIARHYGAEVPFLRPAQLATDLATDLVVFQHTLDWLREHEGREPEILVHLRPTYPRREPADIDRVVDILAADPTLDAVRSVAPAPANPYKMWTRDEGGRLTPVADLGIEAYNQPRQALPQAYLQNACIDAVRSRVIRAGSMTGRHIHGYVMEDNLDVDTHAEFESALAHGSGARTTRTFLMDVSSLASVSATGPGAQAEPRPEVVEAVNRLHDAGCRIVVQWRDSGAWTGMDTATVTAQLAAWGVSHHQLAYQQTSADYLVDGRAVGIGEFLRIAEAIVESKDQQ